jgi:CPW-WPC domain-containing protein
MASRSGQMILFMSMLQMAVSLEPFAILAQQGVWQAGTPININVDYDVPAVGVTDELAALRKASMAEYKVAEMKALVSKVDGPALAKVVNAPTRVSFLRVSQPLEDAGGVLQNSKVSVSPDTASIRDASNVIKGLAQMPAPKQVFGKLFLDPKPNIGADTCDRDYARMCPDGFVNIGTVFGGNTSYCAASSQYDGPCANEPHSFVGMSVSAKARWANLCQAAWPCIRCERDYQGVCPTNWLRLGDSLKCAPPSAYSGPCRGADKFEYGLARDSSSTSYLETTSTDFTGYNRAMLKHWSASCGAFWPCKARS